MAVVTSSRADYGHLYWPLKELAARPSVEPRLIAMGPHLSPEFGHTVAGVEGGVCAGDERVECLLSSDTDVGMAKTIGVATLGLADVLARLRPDILLLIADRYEMLAPAAAALALRIPVAHIEGGEVTEGAIDDAVRNALTKLSHLHLTTTEAARRRVLAMGEETWRVHRVGSSSLHHLTYWSLLACAELFVGNSSSGIMETPSLKLPAVNVGIRQAGRERARNVLDAEPNAESILAEVRRALAPAFRASLEGLTNPYGDGHSPERIAELLAEVPLGEKLFVKRAVPLEGVAWRHDPEAEGA